MSDPKPTACPKCGAPLAPDAPEGLCPRCLVQMNLTAPTQMPGTTGSATAGPPLTPEQIAPSFPQLEILECLGRGGMGVVYKARQPRLNRFVALKILAPGRETDPQFADRFIREAQALAKLNHPNIVGVYDFGESGGMYYLLMEYVDGANVRGLLAGGKLAPAQALAIVPRICEALQYAHEEGVVHRDIKPENVLVDKQGRVKIADFGIARILGVENGATVTRDRYVIGTPYYMAPEQVEHPMTVDHRADIYSLGVVFYEMLTGELPLGRFASPSQKVQVDVRLDEVVLRALEKEPELRYQHASQVKTALDTIASTSAPATAATPASATPVSSFVASPQPTASTSGAPPPPPPLAPNPPSAIPAPPPPSSLAASQPITNPRFSRKAIIGAIWAPVFFFAVIPMFWAMEVHRIGSRDVPVGVPMLGLLIIVPLFFLGLTAPFGTTILGWAAVGDIRRSAGRIHGLWLAVLDWLFFPLLILDVLIVILWIVFAKGFLHWSEEENPAARVTFLAGLTCLMVDVLIIWRVWHAVKTPVNRVTTFATPVSQSGSAGKILVIVALILLLLVAAPVGLLMFFRGGIIFGPTRLLLLFLFIALIIFVVWKIYGKKPNVGAAAAAAPAPSSGGVGKILAIVAVILLLCLAVPVGLLMMFMVGFKGHTNFTSGSMSSSLVTTSGGQSIAPQLVRYLVFTADASAVEKLTSPAQMRTNSPVGWHQEVNYADFQPLVNSTLILAHGQREITLWPQEADSWRYANLNGDSGGGSGSLGVRPMPHAPGTGLQPDDQELQIEYNVSDTHTPTGAQINDWKIVYTGGSPVGGFLTFFKPFTTDAGSRYLVVAFDMPNAQSSDDSPAAAAVDAIFNPPPNQTAPSQDAATSTDTNPPAQQFVESISPNATPEAIPAMPAMPVMPTMPTLPTLPDMPTMPVAARAQSISSLAVTPPAAAPKTWDAADFKRRLEAAQSITNFNQRDTALAALASDAARAGQATETKNIVGSITNFATRDKAASDAALFLFAAGQREQAIDVANLITNFQTRDATLAQLSK